MDKNNEYIFRFSINCLFLFVKFILLSDIIQKSLKHHFPVEM